MATQLLEPPTDFTPFELAEWVEVSMCLEDLSAMSKAEIATRFPINQRPDAAEFEGLVAEVRARAGMAPSVYPFRARDDEIYLEDGVDGTVYFFLLILSLEGAPYRRQSRFNEIGPSLELITREAMLATMGLAGQARRFGWPNDDGRPEHLADAVEWLAREMGLGVAVVREDVDDDDKDGGIDVAAWHPFPDGRPSFPATLVQCTVQATFERKPADVVPEQWIAWIRFGRKPDIGLAIPFALPADAKVRLKLRYTANVLLDRMRLCVLVAGRPMVEFPEYAFMARWTESEIELIRAELASAPRQTGRRKRGTRLARRRRARRTADGTDTDLGDTSN